VVTLMHISHGPGRCLDRLFQTTRLCGIFTRTYVHANACAHILTTLALCAQARAGRFFILRLYDSVCVQYHEDDCLRSVY
jgi:hypothetical protein